MHVQYSTKRYKNHILCMEFNGWLVFEGEPTKSNDCNSGCRFFSKRPSASSYIIWHQSWSFFDGRKTIFKLDQWSELGTVPFGHRFELWRKNNEAGNSLNAVEHEPVPTTVLNPTASEASYEPKQRSYRTLFTEIVLYRNVAKQNLWNLT